MLDHDDEFDGCCEDEREFYEDDLNAWEEEQVFQDREGYDEEPYSGELEDFGPFGIDGMGPDFE